MHRFTLGFILQSAIRQWYVGYCSLGRSYILQWYKLDCCTFVCCRTLGSPRGLRSCWCRQRLWADKGLGQRHRVACTWIHLMVDDLLWELAMNTLQFCSASILFWACPCHFRLTINLNFRRLDSFVNSNPRFGVVIRVIFAAFQSGGRWWETSTCWGDWLVYLCHHPQVPWWRL